MGIKLEKGVSNLFDALDNNNKKDVINYYNNQFQSYKKYNKTKLAKSHALSDTVIKFSISAIRKSINVLNELPIPDYEIKPVHYFGEKLKKYSLIDEKTYIIPHALIDTYINFTKYGKK